MGFHRLTVPAYFLGLPVGYDYANNAIVGTPADIDSPRLVGPNAGTYLVGFGEDAVSKAVNRGIGAALENTDILDNYMRRDLAVPNMLEGETGGAALALVTLPGPIWIGDVGTPNSVDGIRTFITLVDAQDNELFNVTECQVTAISGGTPGAEWSAGNVDITISPPIPVSTAYRVYFYSRKNLVTIDQDAFTKLRKSSIYNGGPAWADGVANPTTTITNQLDKMLSDLAATTGAAKVGAAAVAAGGLAYGLAAGSVRTQLVEVVGSLNAADADITAEATARIDADTAEQTARAAADVAINASLVARRKAWGAIPALTFRTRVTSTTFDIIRYSSVTNTWFGGDSHGNPDYVAVVTDLWDWGGAAWTGSTNISVPEQTGNFIGDMDVNQVSGDLLVVDQLVDKVRHRSAAGVWSVLTPSALVPHSPCVMWEPVSNTYINVFRSGAAGGLIVRTSPTGTTWTIQVGPAFPVDAEATLAHNGSGRVMMQGWSGTNMYTSYSDDAGATWSAMVVTAAGLTHTIVAGRQNPRPVWTGTKWVVINVENTTTSIFSSPDGAAWTLASVFTGVGIMMIAAMHEVLVGITTLGRIVFSLDGTTWRFGEANFMNGADPPRGIYACGNRFIMAAWSRIYPGDGFGESGQVLA